MPTYDYCCAACGHRSERFESIGDDKPKACEKCGKKRARRMIGAGAGFIFKGSGFYVTDYKKGKSGGAPAPKAPESSQASKEPETKAPAAKEKKESKEPKK